MFFALLGILLGATGVGLALTRKAEALPPEVYVPTTNEILSSDSIAKLNAYYDLIGELYISGRISYDEYALLYTAYETRYYDLVEAL